jgi:phosphoglycolate phosphatase
MACGRSGVRAPLGPLFMKKRKIIIFDFDGVIVDTCQLSLEINREVFEDLEVSEIRDWAEGNIFKKKLREGVNDSHADHYYEHYSKGIKSLKPVGGMREVFEGVLKLGYEMVIVSSSFEKVIESFLKDNGLDKYFIEIMGKDTSPSKIAKFKIMFERYGVKAKESLIVTDSVGDVKEAREVEMKAIGVSWGVHEKERLIKNKVDFVADRPEEILMGIKKILALN